jgi:hypothetical protein
MKMVDNGSAVVPVFNSSDDFRKWLQNRQKAYQEQAKLAEKRRYKHWAKGAAFAMKEVLQALDLSALASGVRETLQQPSGFSESTLEALRRPGLEQGQTHADAGPESHDLTRSSSEPGTGPPGIR